MYTLKNKQISFAVDANGKLIELINLATGHNYAGQQGLWRIIYQHGEILEEEITAENCTAAVAVKGNELEIVYRNMVSEAGKVDFTLRIRGILVEDEVRFDAILENNSVSDIIREFQFPMIKQLALQQGQQLYWSFLGGERIKNLSVKLDKCHTWYMGQDNKAIEMAQLYPGMCAMNCYAIAGETEGLYVGSHDPTFQNTLHLFRKRGTAIDAGWSNIRFCIQDKRRKSPGMWCRHIPATGMWRRKNIADGLILGTNPNQYRIRFGIPTVGTGLLCGTSMEKFCSGTTKCRGF